MLLAQATISAPHRVHMHFILQWHDSSSPAKKASAGCDRNGIEGLTGGPGEAIAIKKAEALRILMIRSMAFAAVVGHLL